MVATMGKARLYIQCVIYLCALPRLVVSTSQPDKVVDYTLKSGILISDGYPNTDSKFNGWRIVVEGDYFIRLEFLDFGLQETDNCKLDYLKLFDGPAIDSDQEVGTWCWDNFTELMPNTFISSNNSFYLLFRGHSDHSRKGFRVSYDAFLKSSTSSTVAVTTDPTLTSQRTSKDHEKESSTSTNIFSTTTIATTSDQSSPTSSNKTDGPNQLVLIIVLSSVGGALLFSSVCFVVGYLMANAFRKTKDKRTRSNKGDVSLPLDSRNPVAVSSHTGQGTLQTTDGEGYEDIRHQDNVHVGISRPKLDVPSNESVVYANEANVYSRSITDVLSDENATKSGNEKPVYSRTIEKY